ncbi:MAG: trypsin-like peptidase domain-containing protein [Rhizobiales bacterium]|nr:trypsin-like peptidase domain-containing protein [Hyphomicrobiales bacterium]
MRKTLVAAMALVALTFGLAQAAPVKAPKPEPALSPVVDLQLVSGKHICTGFYVGNGRVVTASHCVDDFAETYKIKFTDGTVADAHIAVIADWKRGFDDFAILTFAEPKTPIRPLQLRCEVPAVGEYVSMTGYPSDMGLTTVWGRVSGGLSTWGPWPAVFRVDIAAIGGNSGSAIVDGEGRVVGILVGGYRDTSFSVAVPMTKVCAMLDIGVA